MHSKSDSKEIMINDKADEAIKKLFKSVLGNSLKGSDSVFDYVHLLS